MSKPRPVRDDRERRFPGVGEASSTKSARCRRNRGSRSDGRGSPAAHPGRPPLPRTPRRDRRRHSQAHPESPSRIAQRRYPVRSESRSSRAGRRSRPSRPVRETVGEDEEPVGTDRPTERDRRTDRPVAPVHPFHRPAVEHEARGPRKFDEHRAIVAPWPVVVDLREQRRRGRRACEAAGFPEKSREDSSFIRMQDLDRRDARSG